SRARRGCDPSPPTPLYQGTDGIDSLHRRRTRAAGADRGRDAAAQRDSRGLRVPPALPACLRTLPARAAGTHVGGRAPRGMLGGGMRKKSAVLHAFPKRSSESAEPSSAPLVELVDVAKHFDVSPPWLNRVIERKSRAVLKAVDGVSLGIAHGETLG